ncbi:hypothetical protein Scep_000963 [Stephania cephalantha]|uniref:Phytocyanin domain-containing protein n=1 Tax=Stephania cephalantha TaxID=152367 RepID=A0AAP0Q2W9_9MAGN
MVGNAGLRVLVIMLWCAAMPISLGIDYTVGDTNGWATNYDYSTWTSGKTFAVGDSLVFNFAGGHTVDEVSESDYSTCTVGNAIASTSAGPASVALKTPGKHYFICGVIGHCGSGMKLAVTVSGSAPAPTGTTTPSGTSSGGAAAGGVGSGDGTTTTTPATTIPKTTTTIYSSSSAIWPSALTAGVMLLVVLKLVV